ncbi:Arrestin C-terminal-like domain [Trinorchestia longiramus]|nr:Arrestin C-terminal-like domain [Trinorchestia longiramus]
MYLTKRCITDFVTHTEPVEGAVLIDPSFVGDRNVFAQIVLKFRFGREDDETMGLNFVKTMCVENKQVYPPPPEEHTTEIQRNLISKLGNFTFPFTLPLPLLSSPTYVMQKGWEDEGALMSLEMEVMAYVGHTELDVDDRSTVRLHIERVQSFPASELSMPAPQGTITRNFLTCSGTVTLTVALHKPVYRPEEDISISIRVANKTTKDVKKLKVKVIQLSEVPMFSNTQRREKTLTKTEEAVMLPPGACIQRTLSMVAIVPSKRAQGTVFLQSDLLTPNCQPTLAQSTLLPADVCRTDIFGIVVSYAVRVKACMGPLLGETVLDVPFVLQTNFDE